MAPILDQSAVNTRNVDLRNPAGRRPDNDQGQQFGDVLSNVSDKSPPSGRKKAVDAGLTAKTQSDQKSRGGRHSSDDDSSSTQTDVQSALPITNSVAIDLTTLAAEAAGAIQTPPKATPSETPVATPRTTTTATAALPAAPSVIISDVAVKTHLDSSAATTKPLTEAPTSLPATKGGNNSEKNNPKAVATATTASPSTIVTRASDTEDLGNKGQGTGSGSTSAFEEHEAFSSKAPKVQEIPASDPSQKADAAPTTAVILVPAGTSPTQAVTQTISTALTQHSATSIPDAIITSTIAPPRTLTLQLTPAGMGTVSVTLHAIGHSLDLQLAVSNNETLGAINRDRDTLAKSVTDQGYDLRTLVIQGNGANVSSDSTGQGQSQSQSGAQTQSGSSHQSAQNRGGNPNQRPQPLQRTPSNETPAAAVRSRNDALFV